MAANNQTRKYKKFIYHIEVEKKPGEIFINDMDYLDTNPQRANHYLKTLKEKYKDHKINITKITETKTYKPITESELEAIAKT